VSVDGNYQLNQVPLVHVPKV